MANVSGKTSNGYSYEGDYQLAGAGRVHWSVTFRHDGDYAGMRHGTVHNMLGLDTASVDDAVKLDIESIWTQAT